MPRAFFLLALAFTVGAVYHLAGGLFPAFGIAGPRWRHMLFVGIDLATAWYLLRRPLWLVPAFLALVAQQVQGHGGRLWRWWHVGRVVDWRSVVVLSVLAVALVLVLWDAVTRLRRGRAAEQAA